MRPLGDLVGRPGRGSPELQLDRALVARWCRLLLTARQPWAEGARDDSSVTDDRPLVVNFLPYKLDGSGPRTGLRTVLLQLDVDSCTGKSCGGYLTTWAIGQTPRFQTAVVCAPVADLESHNGTSDTGYYVGPYSMGGEIEDVGDRYHRLSPVEYCHQAETSTLVLQGQDDQRCPLGQAEELFASLVRCARGRTRMVVYPGGSHALAASGKPSHRVDYHTRLSAWVRGVDPPHPGTDRGHGTGGP